jgi:hypothetical protein
MRKFVPPMSMPMVIGTFCLLGPVEAFSWLIKPAASSLKFASFTLTSRKDAGYPRPSALAC